jgi:hypothetical protein
MYKSIIIKMMLSFYQSYHILIAAKKGLNVDNIIYGHKKCFSSKIHSSQNIPLFQISQVANINV